jgi:RNA polymerase-binding transcription factor DksA
MVCILRVMVFLYFIGSQDSPAFPETYCVDKILCKHNWIDAFILSSRPCVSALVHGGPGRYTTPRSWQRGGQTALLDVPGQLGYRKSNSAWGLVEHILPLEGAMTKAELDAYKETLLSLRNRLSGDVSHLADEALRARGGEASGSLSNTPLHMADLGTDNFEQEFTFSLLQNQEQALSEIGEALERIRQGRFGRCEECKEAIPRARLQALPYTRHCVACALKLQQSS